MIAELTDAEIDELLHEQVVGRIGCHADGVTYVVPVIYAYDGESVHVATIEGQKVRMMRANPSVCFEVDEYAAPGRWRSAIVQGTYEEAEGDEQAASLALLAERFASGGEGHGARRPEAHDRQTVCFRIRVREATGRAVSR
ncbi:MAG TPA: pyridoxamine 5'-phosphate oxidase family protein [Gaiellaceae bacterium]|nr:pyridoxamine 5'-phosphate oxidase family protein [Gaiellaceae bacterium]